jgi:hydrogenase maturation protein HypF
VVRLAQREGFQENVIERMHVTIRGAVQGVGFRPFVYRLANEMGLPGWVLNTSQGVFIEIEGVHLELEAFLQRLEQEKPNPSFIQSMEFSFLDPVCFDRFEIRQSDGTGDRTALIMPDIATCKECLDDIFDPLNRRYLYPFTNCTNCGPRFTIIESLPYDRPNTSMKSFAMCAACREEYEDPQNRRFHAQPNACPVCGPELALWNETGNLVTHRHDALLAAAEAIRAGKLVAAKGVGGFHLFADARNEKTVERLRARKHREQKPLAVMYPSLEAIKADCLVSRLEQRLLQSAESPIVLLKRREKISSRRRVAAEVAPGNPYLGAMLPYTPLHHILARELAFPIIATSGNLSEEPICIDEKEAVQRLQGIADVFLVHNRRIVRHMDDSIARVVLGRELVLRRARGYAPLPLHNKAGLPEMLAVGGHLKNSVAMTIDNNIFISQHIGNLENEEAFYAFNRVIDDFRTLYGIAPRSIVADMHPSYFSTQFARSCGLPATFIQHHHAHVCACMAENDLDGPVLGVSWDGTGYGPDGTIWGGEFLITVGGRYERAATFRHFRLPGGSQAIMEPGRTAISLLYEIMGDRAFTLKHLPAISNFTDTQMSLLRQMLEKGFQAPWTTSAGRLFDGVASLIGLRQHVHFEGQAAMDLEFSITDDVGSDCYPFAITASGGSNEADAGRKTPEETAKFIVDWKPLILAILADLENDTVAGKISGRFHNTLAQVIVEIAARIGEKRVILTGGCFQNKYLLERAVTQLQEAGFKPYWHQRVPPNDGGIALGQIVAASRKSRE